MDESRLHKAVVDAQRASSCSVGSLGRRLNCAYWDNTGIGEADPSMAELRAHVQTPGPALTVLEPGAWREVDRSYWRARTSFQLRVFTVPSEHLIYIYFFQLPSTSNPLLTYTLSSVSSSSSLLSSLIPLFLLLHPFCLIILPYHPPLLHPSHLSLFPVSSSSLSPSPHFPSSVCSSFSLPSPHPSLLSKQTSEGFLCAQFPYGFAGCQRGEGWPGGTWCGSSRAQDSKVLAGGLPSPAE